MAEEIEHPITEQKESIKLIRNSKGYTWEIRVLDLDVERLGQINSYLEGKYGKKSEENGINI